MHNLYISGICGIFWNVLCFAFCFTQFSIGIICIYLEYVKYYGMFFVFFHGLHNVPFYRGKTGHSNGKSWANHHLEEHHLANGDVSMQRNTFLEGKKHSQNGKPQPRAALYASICLEYAEYSGMFYVFGFMFLHTKTIPLTISTTKRVNTCLVPSSDSWIIQAKKWTRAPVFVVKGCALYLVAAFHLALINRKRIL